MENNSDNSTKTTLQISLKNPIKIIPENAAKKSIQSVKQLFGVDQLSELMEPFRLSTGLGVALFDEHFELLASAGWQKICTHFHQKHPEAHRSCIESQNYFRNHFKPDEFLSYKCKNGLWDIAFPIYNHDAFIGYVSFGQFFINEEEITKDFFVQQAQKYNFDMEAYISQLRSIPIFSREKLEAHVSLFLTMLKYNAESYRSTSPL
jgi:ligand-binding sensor protein